MMDYQELRALLPKYIQNKEVYTIIEHLIDVKFGGVDYQFQLSDLQDEVDELEDNVINLESNIYELEIENKDLKKQIEELMAKGKFQKMVVIKTPSGKESVSIAKSKAQLKDMETLALMVVKEDSRFSYEVRDMGNKND